MGLDLTRGGGPHSGQRIFRSGGGAGTPRGAVVMLHGRGAAAEDILSLSERFGQNDIAYFAPQAAGYQWYPSRFIEPRGRNEPWLSAALNVVRSLIADIAATGVPPDHIVLLGFSQGACLAIESAARNPHRYGGIAGLSGGLIGADDEIWDGSGDLGGTPAVLGCSDNDAHIPLARVEATAASLEKAGAKVTKRIYPGSAHNVNEDEIALVRGMLAGLGSGF